MIYNADVTLTSLKSSNFIENKLAAMKIKLLKYKTRHNGLTSCNFLESSTPQDANVTDKQRSET